MKIISAKKIFSLLIFLLIFNGLTFAEIITFSADTMTGTASEKSDRTVLSGNASVKTEKMEISADTIELTGENFRTIIATGNVKGIQDKMDFSCGKMTFDRETKIALLEDFVRMKDSEKDVDAEAQSIEYDQNNEIAVMQFGVSLKQKNNTCTGAYAIYNKKTQMLDMSGNPKVVQGNDTFRAQTISLNLDTQEITLDGRVTGSVTTKK